MSQPRDDWGPALQKHRDEAWEAHKTHGTSMGGHLKLPKKLGVAYHVGKDNDAVAYD